MFKRPGEIDYLKEQAEEESQRMAERLQEIFARKRAEDLAGGGARTRGYATRVLRPRLEELRELVRYGLSIREISRMLTESGVEINYHSLRNFLKKYLPADYAEYLSVEATQPIPQHLADAPPSPGEFDSTGINFTKKAKTEESHSETGNSLLDAANPRKLGIKK